jgi:hypothetical protein
VIMSQADDHAYAGWRRFQTHSASFRDSMQRWLD